MSAPRSTTLLLAASLALAAGAGFTVARFPATADRTVEASVADPASAARSAREASAETEAAARADLRAELLALRDDLGLLEERLEAKLAAALRRDPDRLPDFPLPAAAELAGQPVPLERREVRERLDYELLLTLGRPAMPLLWMVRAGGVRPAIVEALDRAGMPRDLYYVAVVESDLRSQVSSPAGAVGLWQFLRSTGRRYGLRIDRYVDERRHPGRATEAALAYLGELHEEFGDWFLAMAAYNCGENRVREALEIQGTRDFFSLWLPEETRRYVYRALAAKLVLEDPGAYGLRLGADRSRRPPDVTEEDWAVGSARGSLRDLARDRAVSYLELRELNPHLRRDDLPPGTYRIAVPASAVPAEAGGEGSAAAP